MSKPPSRCLYYVTHTCRVEEVTEVFSHCLTECCTRPGTVQETSLHCESPQAALPDLVTANLCLPYSPSSPLSQLTPVLPGTRCHFVQNPSPSLPSGCPRRTVCSFPSHLRRVGSHRTPFLANLSRARSLRVQGRGRGSREGRGCKERHPDARVVSGDQPGGQETQTVCEPELPPQAAGGLLQGRGGRETVCVWFSATGLPKRDQVSRISQSSGVNGAHHAGHSPLARASSDHFRQSTILSTSLVYSQPHTFIYLFVVLSNPLLGCKYSPESTIVIQIIILILLLSNYCTYNKGN